MTGLREAVAHDVPTLLKKWGHILPFDSLANSAQYSVFSRKGFVCHKRAGGRSWQCSVGSRQEIEDRGRRSEGGGRFAASISGVGDPVAWEREAREDVQGAV
jgi:hypothetical protein